MCVNSDFLIKEADRCVKCGLCLPHCPTYQLARDEAESPRGRIALIQGWAAGDLQADRSMLAHLDHCLLCRRCEGACPSGVNYSELMDAARASLPRTTPRWLPDVLADGGRQRMAMKLAAVAGKSGMQAWFPSAIVRRMLRIAATLSASESGSSTPLKKYYAAAKTQQGEVAVFTGCMGATVDRRAIAAAIEIITASGYAVSIPPSQQCCGAMHAHAGYRQRAAEQKRTNLALFAGKGYDSLITLSSGCGSYLADISELDCPVMDAGAFIQQIGGIGSLPLTEIRRKIAIFLPCTLAAMGQQKQVMALLQDLPGAELIELQGMGCCGGAGLHLLTQPHTGEQLVEPLIHQLAASQATLVATTNSGCALQLQTSANKAGLGISVVHPLELVVQQLQKT
jgi:glycolate oxidase iron-sulfur subunit